MVNTQKIKARMTELDLNQTEVAAQIGIAQSTFNQKINNSRPLFLEEVEKLQELLKIDNADFSDYFFYHGVA
jgi:transcriptional regulator with XRE-family HTH domain